MRKGEQKKPKQSYIAYAPPYFGSRELGETWSSDPEKVVGRVMVTSLYALTDDFTKQYLLLKFKIIRVKGNVCETLFYGHEYGREFLRSLVRRGSTRIDGIFDVETRDGFKMRIQATVFTINRVSHSRQKAVRKVMKQVIEEAAQRLTHDQLAQEMVLGKTASDIFNLVKKIVLPRNAGIIKSKVLKIPDELLKEPVQQMVTQPTTQKESEQPTPPAQ
ncbi:MAG TPA: 30S ribosomal protein S3ae [Candidatus Caldiarchaeum subterraneum]|uniref:Small ribosomal subunit protein eS1 n=1 Tax=Caldiarchaeum subterraneum TaxID=311458 RepID=A0A833ECI7_CALS0|nr:30S ribosomal protein S3ae [Candidatus Caldarchaeum subterraneum]